MLQNHPVQIAKNILHKLQSIFATMRYGNPGKKLILIGVTGTDGKTTVSSMIYHVFMRSKMKVAYLSTINAKIGDELIDTGLHVTTPDPWDVPRYLNTMVEKGVTHAVLESTSSGLHQNRLFGIEFDSSIITNIKYDHLDYHGTWENYANAKFRIIEMTKDKGLVVLNKDDKKSAEWIEAKSKKIKQDVYVRWCSETELINKRHSVTGIEFDYEGIEFFVPIIGKHNFLNVIQTISVCNNYLSLEEISNALRSFATPCGRMQILQSSPFTIIVDFAHTPEALKSALESVKDILPDQARIISVFGCAGKRDKGRRKMGEVSCNHADITVLTAEDPRDEKLKGINDEIFKHAEKSGGKLFYRFENSDEYKDVNMKRIKTSIEEAIGVGEKPVVAFDEDSINSRRDAIDFALKIAREGDIVFITGKGHEKSLAFGEDEKEVAWSDQEEVRQILKRNIK